MTKYTATFDLKDRIDSYKRKELIYKINHEENFDKAQGMLEMLNTMCGTKFGFLNKRVVRFENPDAPSHEKYAHCHDAWVEC